MNNTTTKLRLTVGSLRNIQSAHGIANILKPTPADQERMVSLDFLADVITLGTAHMGDARPDVENMEINELLATFKAWHAGDEEAEEPTEGK